MYCNYVWAVNSPALWSWWMLVLLCWGVQENLG